MVLLWQQKSAPGVGNMLMGGWPSMSMFMAPGAAAMMPPGMLVSMAGGAPLVLMPGAPDEAAGGGLLPGVAAAAVAAGFQQCQVPGCSNWARGQLCQWHLPDVLRAPAPGWLAPQAAAMPPVSLPYGLMPAGMFMNMASAAAAAAFSPAALPASPTRASKSPRTYSTSLSQNEKASRHRRKYQMELHKLRSALPAELVHKASEARLLETAAQYVQQLTREEAGLQQEIERLRKMNALLATRFGPSSSDAASSRSSPNSADASTDH